MEKIPVNSTKPIVAKRSWFQFSLRALLVLMLVVGVGLGWFVDRRRKSRKAWEQLRAFEGQPVLFDGMGIDGIAPKVESTGNWLERKLGIDFPKPPKAVMYIAVFTNDSKEQLANTIKSLAQLRSLQWISISSSNHEGDLDEAIAPLAQLPGIAYLEVHEPGFTGIGLRHFSNCATLEHVNLGDSSNRPTRESLRCLSEIPNIKRVDLSQAPITDEMLEVISQISCLEELDLSHTKISDKGLMHLKHSRTLVKLDVVRTKVTDAGLEQLAKVPTLKEMDVNKTRLSESGVVNLRALRSDLKITGHN